MPKNPVDTEITTDQAAILRARGYLTSVEIAEKMGTTLSTVNRWAKEKKVKSLLVTKHLYIQLDSLVDHIGQEQAVLFGFVSPAEKKRK